MDKVKISVIIPVYNAQAHLDQCLDSVLTQSLSDMEVICVDDGSVDESPEILADYASRDRRLTVLTQSNRYAGAARNKGMEAARGTYIAFLDADDYYLPGALEMLYRRAERYSLDFVKSGFQYWNVGKPHPYSDLYSSNSCINLFRSQQVLTFAKLPLRLLNIPDVPWNGLYRKSFLEAHSIRFNHLRCSNDRSFYIACLLNAQRLMVTRKAAVRYRVGQAGSLVGQRSNHFENQIESYYIVRGLCRNAAPGLAQYIMEQELNNIFGWYTRLRPLADAKTLIDSQMSDFLAHIDEEDVGQAFLRAFSYSSVYFRLRYGTEAPPRPSALTRALRCWREHGLWYTLSRFRDMRGGPLCSFY